jgi:hypothetical protein
MRDDFVLSNLSNAPGTYDPQAYNRIIRNIELAFSQLRQPGPVTVTNLTVTGDLVSPNSSGTYTPTLTNVTNVASTNAFECIWSRVNDTVTVSGTLQATPTAGTTSTQLRISLPIPSDFASAVDGAGTAGANTPSPGCAGRIFSNSAEEEVRLTFTSVSTAQHTFGFTFQYIVK